MLYIYIYIRKIVIRLNVIINFREKCKCNRGVFRSVELRRVRREGKEKGMEYGKRGKSR